MVKRSRQTVNIVSARRIQGPLLKSAEDVEVKCTASREILSNLTASWESNSLFFMQMKRVWKFVFSILVYTVPV